MNDGNPELFRRYRLQLFVATWLSYFGFYVVRKVYAVVKLPLKEHFGLDDLQVAWPWTIYLVTYMLGQFLAAWLGRRMESRRILAVGMCVAAAATSCWAAWWTRGIASAFLWMCVTMGIFGFAQATGWPHNVALFANWTRKAERGTLFAIWGTCYQFGAIFGKGLAGFLLGWLGLAWSFYGSSLRAARLHGLLRAARARAAAKSVGLSLAGRGRARAEPAQRGRRRHRQARGVAARLHRLGGRDGPHLLRLQVPALRARLLVRADPRRAFRHVRRPFAAYWSTAFDWVGFLGVLVAGYWSDRMPGARRTPVIFWMTCGCFVAVTGHVDVRAHLARALRRCLLGLIGFMAMGPDSLLSGAGAMDVGSRRQAAVAAGVINGLGSIGPIVQEPAIGWLKTDPGTRLGVPAARRHRAS